jgi:hypothetical protein
MVPYVVVNDTDHQRGYDRRRSVINRAGPICEWRGFVLSQLKEFCAAKKCSREAIKISPKNETANYNLTEIKVRDCNMYVRHVQVIDILTRDLFTKSPVIIKYHLFI